MADTSSTGPSGPTMTPSPEATTAEESNRMSMAGPSMRPAPTAKSAPTIEERRAQEKAAERSRQLVQEMLDTQQQRQNWIAQPRRMKRIQRRLARDPQLRNTLFNLAKGGSIAFTSLDAQSQMQVLRQVRGMINQQAQAAMRYLQQNNLIPDPTNPFNPYNQANPNNIANQQQAMQQGVIDAENAAAAQAILAQDNARTQMEEEQEIETENNHTMQLTGTEQTDIEAYNSQMHSTVPTLSIESGRKDDDEEYTDPEAHRAEEEVKHEGEERALRGLMDEDKDEMMEGMKGKAIEHGEHEALEQVGMAAAKLLMAGG